jgi:hypothetical protein
MANTDINNLTILKFNLEKCILCSNDEIVFSSENKDVQKILKNLKEVKSVSKVNEYVLNLKYILGQINGFLEKNCTHEWVYDTVEYGLDSSKNIKYCNKCFTGY